MINTSCPGDGGKEEKRQAGGPTFWTVHLGHIDAAEFVRFHGTRKLIANISWSFAGIAKIADF